MMSPTEREQMIIEHMPFVDSRAWHMYRKVRKHVERNDLIQIGSLGLIKSIDRFDASLGVPFKAFAKIYVDGAMYEYLRAQNPNGHKKRDGDMGTASLDAIMEADFKTIPAILADTNVPSEICEHGELFEIVMVLMARLSKEERRVILDYYFSEMGITEISKVMRCHKSWVFRLHSSGIEKLKKFVRLKDGGIYETENSPHIPVLPAVGRSQRM